MQVKTAFYSGGGAALASLAAIALLSRFEGHTALRPMNATSHVIYGPEDAPVEGFDIRRTLPGLVINVGSAFFWGAVFAFVPPSQSTRSPRAIVGRAFMTTMAAAILDYGLLPRRLRPGWELALQARSVVLSLVAMGAGLAAGGFAAGHNDMAIRPGNGHGHTPGE